jgi:hypothetical protein
MTNTNEEHDVTLTNAALSDLNEILTRELAGHHNRMESYLLGHDVAINIEQATECARTAHRVRQLRAALNRAS